MVNLQIPNGFQYWHDKIRIRKAKDFLSPYSIQFFYVYLYSRLQIDLLGQRNGLS